ncbi:MAG: acyl-CoA dehydratase activase [Roseburia sp.]|uniref:acyl-CoA dehydratase activase n=1 Tax=Roseburia hominis TaxID=301301 RepID=UPI001F28861C|nr:2-hydroxyacyl-CoA dehydratase [Roseburia hominis]
MLGYVCKYTPIELLESMGVEMKRLEPSVTDFTQADTLMHANICSYTKAVLEDVMEHDYEGVILTTCCDSIRRLYDTLKNEFPDKFFFLIDIPRKVNDFAVTLYERQMKDLLHAYNEFSGRTFDEKKFLAMMQGKHALVQKENHSHVPNAAQSGSASLNLGIMGARCNHEIRNLLEEHGVNLLFDLTCTGISRDFALNEDFVLSSYAQSLLNQIPCLRMLKATDRTTLLDGFSDRLDGIIYHTVKFCDSYSYEYADLKKYQDLPVLLVETDSTRQCVGQIRTRVEAFLEERKATKGLTSKEIIDIKRKGQPMYTLGIDSGSTSTNAVILDENRTIKAFSVLRTGAKSSQSANAVLEDVLKKANLKKDDITRIVSTGYGRVSIPFADTTVTEISCHGKGAHFLFPTVHTILDIGGQDSKGIRLNDNGEVVDFVMNDKCAAGTGRFLEMMARTLEISIDELGPISLKSTENIEISSMCSVFAESEVISLIAQNKEIADIAHGIHTAIAKKAISLLKRVGLTGDFMMTGGVAKNPGVVAILEKELNSKLFIYEEPEIVGALGAALYGLEELEEAVK